MKWGRNKELHEKRRRNVILKSTNFNQDRKRNLWRKIIWCYNVLITRRGFLEDMIYLNWFKSSNINSASQLHKHNRLVCAIKGKATERGICLLGSSSDHLLRGLEQSFALLLYDILCRKDWLGGHCTVYFITPKWFTLATWEPLKLVWSE